MKFRNDSTLLPFLPRPSLFTPLARASLLVSFVAVSVLAQPNVYYSIDTVAGQHPLGHPEEEALSPSETLFDRPVAIATAAPDFAFVYLSDLDSRRVRTFSYGLPDPKVRTYRQWRVFSLAYGEDFTRYFGGRGWISVMRSGEADRSIDGLDSDGQVEVPIGEVSGLAPAGDETFFFADATHHVIRRVRLTGEIETVAGVEGHAGDSGDGGPATAALLDTPQRLAMDASGNLYIADAGNSRIRRLSPDGTITTVAGNGSHGPSQPGGLATESPLGNVSGVLTSQLGDVFFTDSSFHQVLRVRSTDGVLELVAGGGARGFDGDGGPAVDASFDGPLDLAWGYGGTLLIADANNSRIRGVSPEGEISTVAGISHFGGDGGPARDALMNRPGALAVTPDGELVIADTGNHRIRKVSSDDTITTFAGTGVPGFSGDLQLGTLARLDQPDHVAIDSDGNVLFADSANRRVRRIGADGVIQTIAGTGDEGDSGDGGPAAAAAFRYISGLAVDGDGWVYVSDGQASRIRRFQPGGDIEAFAGTGQQGFSGDGGPALEATMRFPGPVALHAETLYFVDRGNLRLRSVSPEGTMNTVAGSCCNPPTDPVGGADALSIRLPWANGLAVDSDGNIFLSADQWPYDPDYLDQSFSAIYKIETDGQIWPLVLSLNPGFHGDGGPAALAELHQVKGLAVDGLGNVYAADKLNHRIRRLSPTPPVSLEIIGGSLQTATVGFHFADPLAVIVKTADGTPLPGVRIDVAVVSGDASIAGQSRITQEDGIAQFNVLAGSTPGDIVVQASVTGLSSVQFNLKSVESTAASPPVVTGGVFGAPWSHPPNMVLSSGGLATVYGLRFFSGGGLDQVLEEDLVEGKLPTRFRHTCVLINGKRAFFLFAGGPQVNVQVPDLGDATTAQVQVVRDCDLPTEIASEPIEVPAQKTAPEFFYWVRPGANQAFPIAALDPITGIRVGSPGLLGETLEFAPARPGELVDLYATGFGATDPPVEPGELPDILASVVGGVSVTIDGQPIAGEDIPYVGATRWAGVYLLRIRLPADVRAGRRIVRLSVDGFAAPDAYLEVGN